MKFIMELYIYFGMQVATWTGYGHKKRKDISCGR